jgi:hypothetical protein
MLSLIVGIIRAVLDFTYPAPPCGSGGEDTRMKPIIRLFVSEMKAVV